jgi:hypothetical protein
MGGLKGAIVPNSCSKGKCHPVTPLCVVPEAAQRLSGTHQRQMLRKGPRRRPGELGGTAVGAAQTSNLTPWASGRVAP